MFAVKEASVAPTRGARRRSGGQGIFLDLLHASERTGTQGQRPEGPKELSPGRQPWVQKALWFAGAPAGRKKRSRRGPPLVLPPLAALDQRLGLVSQGLRPGLSPIASQAGSADHPGTAINFHKCVMEQWQDSRFYVAHPRTCCEGLRISASNSRGLIGGSRACGPRRECSADLFCRSAVRPQLTTKSRGPVG
jgi:hypothetical protein